MLKFTKIADFILPDLPYRFVGGGQDYSTNVNRKSNLEILKSIKQNYNIFIKQWADVFEIGEPVLTSFIAVESGGKMVGKNRAGAIGLTQVTVTAIIEAVTKFKIITREDLPSQAVSLIKEKAPYLLSLTANNQNLSSANTSKLESVLSKDANFNIMAGAMVLRWNLEITKANQLAYVQKGIIAYNQSAYGRISKYKAKFVSTNSLFQDKIIPKETRNYLVKVLGKDGYLQLYVVENV
jgi:soluble lytic murein transglycosylase-like protein